MSTDSGEHIDDGLTLKGESDLSQNARTPHGPGQPHVYRAVFNGRDKEVKELIKNSYEVDSIVVIGLQHVTILELASTEFLDVVEFPFESLEKGGYKITDATSLWIASALGHVEVVRVLADAAACVDCSADGIPALVAAACNGHSGVVRLLIARGADVNSSDRAGRSALFISAQNGYGDQVKYLIDSGAEVDKKDEDDRTALLEASLSSHFDIVKYLVEAGADLNAQERRFGETPLSSLIRNGRFDLVQYIVNAGACCNMCDTSNSSPLFTSSILGHADITELLINAGAEINIPNTIGDIALSAACDDGHADVVKLLLSAGAAEGPTESISAWVNKLQYAISNGRNEMIQLIAYILAHTSSSDSMQTPTIQPKSIESPDSIRTALIMTQFCNFRLENAQSYIVFWDAVDYNMFNQRLHLAEATSMQEDIHITLPVVSELIQCPGIGTVNSIAEKKTMEITGFVNDEIERVVKSYNEEAESRYPPGFGEVTIVASGSSAEGTKVGFPNEFDYMLKFSPPNEGEIVDFKDGFKFYRTGIHDSEELYFFGQGSKSFHEHFYQCLVDSQVANDHDLFLELMHSPVKGGGEANTAIKISWVEQDTDNKLLISVDLVPILFFENEWPEYLIQRTWMMDKEELRSRGFALVAKPPYRNSPLAKEIREEDRVMMWGISCPHLETEHIASLEPWVREAYTAAKCLRDPEVCRIMLRDTDGILHNVTKHVPSYLLKTVFLHNVEDFLRGERSLIEMVYITYSDLEYCLSRCFLPLFWQHNVNLLAGHKVDPRKALRATKLMREFVGRMYIKETDCDTLSEFGECRKLLSDGAQGSVDEDGENHFSCDTWEELTVYARTNSQTGPATYTLGCGVQWEGDEEGISQEEEKGTRIEKVDEVTVYSRTLPTPKPNVYHIFTEDGEPHQDVYKFGFWANNSSH